MEAALEALLNQEPEPPMEVQQEDDDQFEDDIDDNEPAQPIEKVNSCL